MRPTGRPRVAATALAALLLGVPATLLTQDTYYVVIGHDDEARDVLLSVHNSTNRAQPLDILPIVAGTNGTQRPTPPTTISVPAGRTTQYSRLASEHPTMIELVTYGELVRGGVRPESFQIAVAATAEPPPARSTRRDRRRFPVATFRRKPLTATACWTRTGRS